MSKIIILAFDPGTANLGYSVLCGDTEAATVYITSTVGVLKTSKRQNGVEVPIRERIDHLSISIQHLVEKVKPTFTAMEDFVEQGKFVGKTYKEMAFLTEHMRLLMRDLEVDNTIYPNGDWKKKTLGIKRATKLQVQHYIQHKLPESIDVLVKQPDHVWDATGIGYTRWLDLLAEITGGNKDEEKKNRGPIIK